MPTPTLVLLGFEYVVMGCCILPLCNSFPSTSVKFVCIITIHHFTMRNIKSLHPLFTTPFTMRKMTPMVAHIPFTITHSTFWTSKCVDVFKSPSQSQTLPMQMYVMWIFWALFIASFVSSFKELRCKPIPSQPWSNSPTTTLPWSLFMVYHACNNSHYFVSVLHFIT